MSARAMDMPVRNFFSAGGPDTQNLNLIVQGPTGVRMVGIDINIKLSNLHHQRIFETLIGLHSDNRTRYQRLGIDIAVQVLDRQAH